MDDVIKYLNSLNIGDDYVIAGISGGPDSMCLLDILHKLKLNIVVSHVNHNVRKESIEEEKYLEEYCKMNNIIFESMTITKYHDNNFHKDARDIRYDFYRKLIKKYHAKYLMTAHHGDDLVETILMRLTRGTSFLGYSGFQIINKEKDYYLVRPLITKTKKQLLEYVMKNKIKYYIDSTNNSDEYTRNRYRKYILPKLKEEDPNVHLKYIKFSMMLKKYDNFINRYLDEIFHHIYINNVLSISNYLSKDELIREKIIERVLSVLYDNNIYLINDKHKQSITRLIANSKSNAEVLLPNNLHVIKSYDKLLFEFDFKEKRSFNYILNDSQLLGNGYSIQCIQNSDDTSNNTIRLLSTDIKLPIHIRSRLDGDTMIVKNLNGHKKLKDIFINEKVDKNTRNNYPIVTDDNNVIIWLPGIKKSNLDRSINENYDIILRYNKEGINNEK